MAITAGNNRAHPFGANVDVDGNRLIRFGRVPSPAGDPRLGTRIHPADESHESILLRKSGHGDDSRANESLRATDTHFDPAAGQRTAGWYKVIGEAAQAVAVAGRLNIFPQ